MFSIIAWRRGKYSSVSKYTLLENSEDDLKQIHKSALENLKRHFNN